MTRVSGRRCPICGSAKNTVLHHQEFFEGPLGDGYDVVVCDKCGFGFADGVPLQAEMDRYYAEESKYTYSQFGGRESPWDFKRFEATLEQLAPYAREMDAAILDIGCATGGMLSVLRQAGYENTLGTDPSQACADAAARLHGLKVVVATIDQLANWTSRFDLILMLGVLEHLRDPENAVRIARSLLKDGGFLYVAVPDVEGLADCPNAPFQQFSFEHFNFFSVSSLNNLLAASGMGPVCNWRWTKEWRENVMEPIASGLYTSSNAPAVAFDDRTRAALETYIGDSASGDQGLFAVIDRLKHSQEPVLIWGAGTLARRLLACSQLSEANIVAFVDSDTHLQGKQLAGRPILAPEELVARQEPILICSMPFNMEIRAKIKAMGLPNGILSLGI
jgi:SAM-dependent methyltransferase